jgi:hypothetical protein
MIAASAPTLVTSGPTSIATTAESPSTDWSAATSTGNAVSAPHASMPDKSKADASGICVFESGAPEAS